MKILVAFSVLCLLFLAACGASSQSPFRSSVVSCPTGNVVKTAATSFEQSCITLSKGSSLTIEPDQVSYHVFAYGQWNGLAAEPQTQPGAPTLSATMNSQSVTVGPFTTAGTYYIYCTIHPGMQLTIIVS